MYGIVKLRENPCTGVGTWAVSPELWRLVATWHDMRGRNPWDKAVVRDVRMNANGHVTFKAGGGYAFVDADLLGGNGDGREESAFIEWARVDIIRAYSGGFRELKRLTNQYEREYAEYRARARRV